MRVFSRVFLFCSEAFGGATAAPPKATATRDMRFDAIRGLLLISMAAVHVPTPVSYFLHEPLGFMSDAEGFIFLSACLAGLAYGKTYRQTDWSAMSRRVWHRAKQIYLIHLAVILPVVLTAWAFAGQITPLANHFHDFLVHPWGSLALIPLLLHQPPLFDILPLYIILLGVTPLLLALARRRGWGIVLAASACGWIAAQFKLDTRFISDPSGWLPLRWGSFDLLAWQLVWVGGLALGETTSRRPVLSSKWRFGLAAISVPIAVLSFLARHGFLSLNPDCFLWIDKWTLGPLRLLNFASWVALLLAWNPRVPACLLAPVAFLGRHSLAVFAFHLPLVVVASTIVQLVPLSDVWQIGVSLSVIAALFLWATWLEYTPRPPAPAVAPFVPSRRLPLRIRIRSVELFPAGPVRPSASRIHSNARTAHA
jgi:hypothetical protein